MWLVPNLPTAPAVAYHQPRVTLVEHPASGRATVELPDGRRLNVDLRNLRRTPPTAQCQRRPRTLRPRRLMDLPDGWEEQPLW